MQGGSLEAICSTDGGEALTEKARSPLVFKRERGTDKRALSVDLKCLVDDKGIRRASDKMELDC